jgi:hypothetical protein
VTGGVAADAMLQRLLFSVSPSVRRFVPDLLKEYRQHWSRQLKYQPTDRAPAKKAIIDLLCDEAVRRSWEEASVLRRCVG